MNLHYEFNTSYMEEQTKGKGRRAHSNEDDDDDNDNDELKCKMHAFIMDSMGFMGEQNVNCCWVVFKI